MKLYENDRHEILNEVDRSLVFDDLLTWMEKRKRQTKKESCDSFLFWLFKGMRVKCTSSSYPEDELLYEGGDSCSINYLTLV